MANRDTWTNLRAAIRTTGKLNKYFTINSFSTLSGFPNRCLNFIKDFPINTGSNYDMSSVFTIKFWFRNTLQVENSAQVILSNKFAVTAGQQLIVYIQDSKLKIGVIRGAVVSTLTSNDDVGFDVWTSVAITFDGNTVLMYINGVLQSNTLATGGSLDTDGTGNYILYIGGTVVTNLYYFGYLDELLIYSAVKTQDEIITQQHTPRAIDETDLEIYYRFNEPANPNGTFTCYNLVTGTGFTILNPGLDVESTTETAYPARFGASYIVAQIAVTLGVKSSLKYPIASPDESNVAMVVRWTDDNDVVQRRLLFDAPDGVSIYPMPEDYNGEALNSPYTIEFWNVDGEDTSELTEDLVVYVSLTSDPLTSTDHDNILALDSDPLDVDTSLAADLPLVLPNSFNEERTFLNS